MRDLLLVASFGAVGLILYASVRLIEEYVHRIASEMRRR